MQESGVISDYLASLEGALSFDRTLSRCVRQEVEDHLWEVVAANPTGNRLEAERRAIANFGDPHVIAAQFAVVSLAKQTRRLGVAVILVIAGVFVAMKARVALMQCAISDDMKAVGGIVALIDHYAFWLSVIVGMAGLVYIGSRPVPNALYPAYQKQLRRFNLLCTAATGALIISVVSDGVLTALRLPETGLSADFLIPVFSMAIEVACAGVLILHIRSMTRRTASTAALPNT